ncbi:hypothetical protein D3C87_945170 [compost metagenome]
MKIQSPTMISTGTKMVESNETHQLDWSGALTLVSTPEAISFSMSLGSFAGATVLTFSASGPEPLSSAMMTFEALEMVTLETLPDSTC